MRVGLNQKVKRAVGIGGELVAVAERRAVELVGDEIAIRVVGGNRPERPGADKESNWLPVAQAPFTLLMRLYSPKAEFLEGAWTPPAVRRDATAR